MLSLNTVHEGDCLELMTSIPDRSVDMVLCDLPYGTTDCGWDSIISLDKMWTQYNRIIKPNGAIVLTAQQPFSTILGASNIKMLRYEWIWQKNIPTGHLNAKRSPLKSHEQVLVFYKRAPSYHPQGLTELAVVREKDGRNSVSENYAYAGKQYRQRYTNYPKDILKFNSERGLHPTQKPVALMEYLIRTYTDESETVLDNCLGSGTTAIAAINARRQWIGIERDPVFAEVSRLRIAAHA